MTGSRCHGSNTRTAIAIAERQQALVVLLEVLVAVHGVVDIARARLRRVRVDRRHVREDLRAVETDPAEGRERDCAVSAAARGRRTVIELAPAELLRKASA